MPQTCSNQNTEKTIEEEGVKFLLIYFFIAILVVNNDVRPNRLNSSGFGFQLIDNNKVFILDNGLRFGELVFSEFFGYHPVSRNINPLFFRSGNHVE